MGSQSHKRGCLCCYKSKERESVDSVLARDHVSKLLYEVAIDLRLNLIVKISILL